MSVTVAVVLEHDEGEELSNMFTRGLATSLHFF